MLAKAINYEYLKCLILKSWFVTIFIVDGGKAGYKKVWEDKEE